MASAAGQHPLLASPAGESKLDQVQRLIDTLKADLEGTTLSPAERAAALSKLKVFGRDANHSDPIFTKEGIEILCRHGFGHTNDDESTREALRCIANALLIVPATRQTFVDLGYASKAADGFQSDSPDDEFLLGRILLVITYGTTADLGKLLEENDLSAHINSAITRHSKGYSKTKNNCPSAMQDMALSETLKLLFNIAHFVPSKADSFSSSIPNIFKILCRRQLLSPPLQPPVTYLINALLSLDLSSAPESVFPYFDSTCNVTRLIEILDLSADKKSAEQNGEEERFFDETGAPLLTLLRKVYEISPENAKSYMQKRLLPPEEDRDNPLGHGDSLAARLLRLSTSAMAPSTREHVSSLLFELSNSNPEEFVHNVGYGYASGLLLSRGIQLTQSAFEKLSVSPGGDERPINPITGQALASEPEVKDPLGDMTDEEKEREAERLFVLFERLKNTGVVNVKNPIEQAVQEGRFEELD